MIKKILLSAPAALLALGAHAAEPTDSPYEVLTKLINSTNSSYLTQSEQNLMIMPDDPALLTAEEGEALFKEKRGPNNVSLEGCDFGKGPGVVKGVYVEMPRYFADTDKVMTFESRLIHCMMTQQGFATATDLADYLVRKGMPFRDAHEVVGRAVRAGVESGRDLAEMSLEELQRFSPTIAADVFDVLSLEGSVAARDHLGGTAPNQVRAATERARAWLRDQAG